MPKASDGVILETVKKYLTLLLILAMSAQPLPADVCDMSGKSSDVHEYSAMNRDGDHATMQHELPKGSMKDCCNADSRERQAQCDSSMNCGACSVSTYVLIDLPRLSGYWRSPQPGLIAAGELFPSHAYPPYRPPIS